MNIRSHKFAVSAVLVLVTGIGAWWLAVSDSPQKRDGVPLPPANSAGVPPPMTGNVAKIGLDELWKTIIDTDGRNLGKDIQSLSKGQLLELTRLIVANIKGEKRKPLLTGLAMRIGVFCPEAAGTFLELIPFGAEQLEIYSFLIGQTPEPSIADVLVPLGSLPDTSHQNDWNFIKMALSSRSSGYDAATLQSILKLKLPDPVKKTVFLELSANLGRTGSIADLARIASAKPPDVSQNNVYSRFFQNYKKDTPAVAYQELLDNGSFSKLPFEAYTPVLDNLYRKDRQDSLIKAAAIPDDLASKKAVSHIVERWFSASPVELSEYVSSLPAGFARDFSAYKICGLLNPRTERTEILSWANSIKDEKWKNAALRGLNSQQ